MRLCSACARWIGSPCIATLSASFLGCTGTVVSKCFVLVQKRKKNKSLPERKGVFNIFCKLALIRFVRIYHDSLSEIETLRNLLTLGKAMRASLLTVRSVSKIRHMLLERLISTRL